MAKASGNQLFMGLVVVALIGGFLGGYIRLPSQANAQPGVNLAVAGAVTSTGAGTQPPGLPATSLVANSISSFASANAAKNVVCAYPGTGQQALTVNQYDWANPGQFITSGTWTGYAGAQFFNAQTSTTAVTISPGAYLYLFSAGNASYFKGFDTENTPCSGAYAANVKQGFIGGTTINIINTTNGAANTISDSSMATGGQITVTLQVTQNASATNGGGAAYASNPQIGQLYLLEGTNQTSKVNVGGYNLATCTNAVPKGIALFAVSNSLVPWSCPYSLSTTDGTKNIPMLVSAVAGQNPTTTANVTVYFIAADYVLGLDGSIRADGANDAGTLLIVANRNKAALALQ